ncbi:MAG: hypothetical protein J2P38_09680, partial [Candidatus Dormibacteraeota bacterium]|nr:hypothetical protein [Candidatus Dormibacteraeota bacterium]
MKRLPAIACFTLAASTAILVFGPWWPTAQVSFHEHPAPPPLYSASPEPSGSPHVSDPEPTPGGVGGVAAASPPAARVLVGSPTAPA